MIGWMRLGLVGFLQRETHALNRKLLILTAASGIANAMNLAVINAAVDALRGGGPSWQHFVWFGLSISLFVYSLRYILYGSTRISEAAICRVRLRLADKIRRSDLLALESIGESDIHARISRDMTAISQAARPLFAAAQGVVMIVFTLGYIAIVSPIAMALCLGLIALGAGKYFKDRAAYDKGLSDASGQEDELFNALNGLLKGFKEIRINRLKSEDVFQEFKSTATRVFTVRTRVNILFSNNIIFVEMFFVLLLGAVAFVLPVIATSFSGSATKIVAAILFFFGPLINVVTLIPMLSQVNVSVDNLERLEAALDEGLKRSMESEAAPIVDMSSFAVIRLEGVCFAYMDVDGNATFQVGPIDGEIRRGEVLFLIGGNGGGKTTLLKLFTALYQPTEGAIYIDGARVGPVNIQSYRDLFSAVFSDFYLFDKLYGLSETDPERVNALLELMGIADKTAFSEGRFTNIQLSTGQRKRLALVVSYLEDKPIYVFDEVAADQDPEFRRYFYERLLPEMKKVGKTVVVVSHDDRYFHAGDRILQMDYGKLSAVPATPTKAAVPVAPKKAAVPAVQKKAVVPAARKKTVAPTTSKRAVKRARK
jgi:putative ATP-binding cassette transporter